MIIRNVYTFKNLKNVKFSWSIAMLVLDKLSTHRTKYWLMKSIFKNENFVVNNI